MIDLPPLLAFVAAAAVLAITPGLDTAIVFNTAVANGKRSACLAATGVGLGCLCWGAAVSVGLAAVLQTSQTAYTIVKYLGVLYLLWLGIGLLLRPRNTCPANLPVSRQGGVQSFAKGLTANVLNPKVGVFYLTFLPQFVPPGASVAGYSLLLASIHVLLSMVWFGLMIVATLPLSQFLAKPATIRVLDRLTGGIFVTFAAKLGV
jgi:threonine/homoserine/homoserine lactone efflux protein